MASLDNFFGNEPNPPRRFGILWSRETEMKFLRNKHRKGDKKRVEKGGCDRSADTVVNWETGMDQSEVPILTPRCLPANKKALFRRNFIRMISQFFLEFIEFPANYCQSLPVLRGSD